MDQYQASNYHVEMSTEEEEIEESNLVKFIETPTDDQTFYMGTRKLQRKQFESKSVEQQLLTFIWLNNVSFHKPLRTLLT